MARKKQDLGGGVENRRHVQVAGAESAIPGSSPLSEGSVSPAQPSIPQLAPGVYEKVDPAIYHRQNSFSRADMILAAVPAKLKYHKDHPEVENVTPAKIIGSAFHTKLLEPEVFDARYTLSRYEEYRSNEAKNWRDEQTAKGLTLLSREDVDMIDQMVQSCREHPNFSDVFRRNGMRRELTVIAKDPATGLLLRARYDIVPGGNVIPDIKSTIDASPEGFGNQVWNLNYGAQCAHYLHVWNLAHPNAKYRKEHFVFLAVEKEPPFLSAMYLAPQSLIQYWDAMLRARRYVIASCLSSGTWPGYPITDLRNSEFELPKWAVNEINDFAEKHA
jgi:hypothetical protein